MSKLVTIGPLTVPAGTYLLPQGGGSVSVPAGTLGFRATFDLTNWTDGSRTLSMQCFLDRQDGNGFVFFGGMSLVGDKGLNRQGIPPVATDMTVQFSVPANGTEKLKAIVVLTGPSLTTSLTLEVF